MIVLNMNINYRFLFKYWLLDIDLYNSGGLYCCKDYIYRLFKKIVRVFEFF